MFPTPRRSATCLLSRVPRLLAFLCWKSTFSPQPGSCGAVGIGDSLPVPVEEGPDGGCPSNPCLGGTRHLVQLQAALAFQQGAMAEAVLVWFCPRGCPWGRERLQAALPCPCCIWGCDSSPKPHPTWEVGTARASPRFAVRAPSSWELPDLREGRVKAISDSDGVSYPWYGNTTETVTLVGPTNKISRFSVSMNDNFYPSVTWAVPVSNSNVPLLTRIKRDQSFTTWLVAMNTTTKEKIILQTIKWRMRVDIEVDPMQLLGQRARLVGRTQQEQPRILSRMEPIPPNALVKPNANDAQVLMWRPKRGQPIVVIPPK
uniref:Family with sequence similarity 78 member B n=1 Tax=Apteryx owenii TaxID=8824 RepID=A0A8B9Q3C3_APTOW